MRKLRLFPDPEHGQVRFHEVSLAPSFHRLNLTITPGSWVLLYGEDDFAKALFCDLCFSYIAPDSGTVAPCLKGSDVSFLGRSNTTYGTTLIDHLSCGVQETSKDLLEFVAQHMLSERFQRHLAPGLLAFKDQRKAHEVDLDERDFLEIAEANLMLQKRRAAVIDVTTDFYQIALEQGFRHSDTFLNSGKTITWLLSEKHQLPLDATPWIQPRFAAVKKLSLSFPNGSPAGYIN